MKTPARRFQLAPIFLLTALLGLAISAHRMTEATSRGTAGHSPHVGDTLPSRISGKAVPIKLTGTNKGATESAANNGDETAAEPVQSGGSYNITQSLVPGGGGASASGSLAVTGSIGQPVLGVSSGGSFSLSGGFWAGGGACAAITISPANTALPAGSVGVSYMQALTPTGVAGTITWSRTGTLPDGLLLDSTTGILSGTPTQPGNFNFTVRASDASGCFGEHAYTLTINCQAITVNAPATNTGTVGVAFSATFTQAGGIGTTAFSTASALPNGIMLSPAGLLSGIPSAAGTFPITVRAADANGCPATINYTLTINPAAIPTIVSLDPAVAPAGSVGFTLIVSGAGFTNSSVVRWNSSDRGTTFVNETQLRAAIPAADIAAIGTASVTVFTPGGGTTSALPFSILSPIVSASAASFLGQEIAQESIVAGFGVNLATSIAVADTVPLPTTLASTTLKVRDSVGTERAAPLFFVSPAQVNFALPVGVTQGTATVTSTNGNGTMSTGNVAIVAVAPGLFAANSNGQGVAAALVLRVKANGTQVFEQVAVFDPGGNSFVAAPIDLGPPEEQVFLILYGTGMRFRSSLSGAQLTVGGTALEVLFLGGQGVFVGLDQLNARLPRSLAGRGQVNVVLVVDGKPANVVAINIR